MKKLYTLVCLHIIITFFLILLLMFYTFLYNILYKESIPKIYGYGFCAVVTDSMEPNISIGDTIIIKKSFNYEIGDIITFKSKNGLVTHRIIDYNNDGILTKGDNNNYIDDIINIDSIEGKTIKIIPKLGGIILTFKKPISIIIFSAILLIVSEFCHYIKNND